MRQISSQCVSCFIMGDTSCVSVLVKTSHRRIVMMKQLAKNSSDLRIGEDYFCLYRTKHGCGSCEKLIEAFPSRGRIQRNRYCTDVLGALKMHP